MGPSANDIITLAKSTKALSKEQLERILRLAPGMSTEDLEKLRKMLLEAQQKEIERMKKDVGLRQLIAASQAEWKADKNRDMLQTQEGAVVREDTAQAEALIQNL